MARVTRLNGLLLAAAMAAPAAGHAIAADSVMVQCGQQYQAAKVAGTLAGLTWNQYRGECAARMKAQPAATPTAATSAGTTAAPVAPAPASVAATPATPAPATVQTPAATATAAPPTGGRAAMLVRQKQCGAEWRAQKATLVAQTPGLTWPRYWSQCNTRLKAAGR